MISDDHDDARQAMQVIVMEVANIKKMAERLGGRSADIATSVAAVERNIERLDVAIGRIEKRSLQNYKHVPLHCRPKSSWCAAATGCAMEPGRFQRAGCPYFEQAACPAERDR